MRNNFRNNFEGVKNHFKPISRPEIQYVSWEKKIVPTHKKKVQPPSDLTHVYIWFSPRISWDMQQQQQHQQQHVEILRSLLVHAINAKDVEMSWVTHLRGVGVHFQALGQFLVEF